MVDPIVTIYHIEGRRSERVAWLCEELGLPYKLEFKPGDLMGSMMAIGNVSSMRVAPAVRIGEHVMVESGAILEYLQLKFGKQRLMPAFDSADLPYHLQWLHYAEGSAMYRIVAEHLLRQIKETFEPTAITQLHMNGGARTFAFMEEHLQKMPYFGGTQFTSADIMMHFPVKIAGNLLKMDSTAYPSVSAWRAKVETRAAFQRAMTATLPNGPVY
ncbi:MAG: glutathione S-transferase N-terminal domain-containing protein [Steroidobacteraceae bacterium]